MKRYLCITLLLGSICYPAGLKAQEPEVAAEKIEKALKNDQEKLLKRLDELERINSKLQAEIKFLHQREDNKRTEADFEHRIQDFYERLTTRPIAVAEAREAYEVQLKSLRMRLEELSAKQALMRNASGASVESSRVIANRLAEAELENRLRKLESQAMVEVLQAERAALADDEKAAKEQALTQAQMLFEKRAQMVDKLRAQLSEKRDSVELKAAFSNAEQALHEAYEVKKAMAAKTQLKRLSQIDERIAEASLQLGVAQIMERNFAAELEKVRELMEVSSNIERVDMEMEAVQQHLLELKKMASDRELEVEAQRLQSKAEMEQLLKMLQEQKKLSATRLGPDHPQSKALDAKIKAVIELHGKK